MSTNYTLPPSPRSRCCKLIDLLYSDVSGRILVDGLDDWLQMHEVDVIQSPDVVLAERTSGRSTSLDFALVVIEPLQVVVIDSECEVLCFHD